MATIVFYCKVGVSREMYIETRITRTWPRVIIHYYSTANSHTPRAAGRENQRGCQDDAFSLSLPLEGGQLEEVGKYNVQAKGGRRTVIFG